MSPESPSNLYALGLIGLILWTITMIAIMSKKRRHTIDGILWLLIALVVSVFAVPVVAGPTAAGGVFDIVPALAFAATMVAVKPKLMRIVASVALFVFGVYLSWSAHFLPGHVGETKMYRTSHRIEVEEVRTSFSELLKHYAEPDTLLPAGWLREPPYDEWGIAYPQNGLKEVQAIPYWHSWLTGQYKRLDIPKDAWTPGGTPDEALAGLRIIPRD